ncbi:MAG: MSCRAMM family adhesin SdrC [Fibrobacterales bacterium]
MTLFKTTLMLLGLTFFVGCLGEDATGTTADDKSSQQEESSDATVAQDESSDNGDANQGEESSDTQEDNSSEATTNDSSESQNTDESSEATTDESSEATTSNPESSATETDPVSSSDADENPATDGIVFENFETTTGQLVFAKKAGSEGGLTALTAGGYWFVYADEETPAAGDEASSVKNADGEVIDTLFSALIEDDALHAFLHASGKIEAAEGRQATIGVNLIGDGEDGLSVDLTGLTEVTIIAKGDGTLTCGFNTAEPTRPWGTFNGRLDLGNDYEEHTFKTTELIGELYSEVSDEPLSDYLATVTQFSCDAKSGVEKPKDIEIYIQEITMKGITYADVTINE